MTGIGAYPAYKASGADWLGPIPGHWNVSPLGQHFRERKGTVSDADFPALSVTKHGIVPQLGTAAKTDNGDSRKLVMAGDFAINSRSDRKGSSGVSPLDGSVSLITTVITPRGLDPHFVHHLLRSEPFQEEYYRFGNGIVADLWSTRYSQMKSISIVVPPFAEQQLIAAFLDREIGQIDTLISKQEQLVGMLTDRRQAVITQAVTHGLDPETPLETTSDATLGEIPRHWTTHGLRHALKFLTSGSRGWAEYYADEGVPFIRIGNLPRVGYELEMGNTQYVQIPPNAEGTRAITREGDLLFSITAFLGSIAVVTPETAGSYISQHVAIVRLKTSFFYPRFVAYFALGEPGQRQLKEQAYGGTKLQLSLQDIRNWVLAVPPLAEQLQISAYLDAETARIDMLQLKAREVVEVLKERRQALISAAVTGKIDVRGL